MTHIVKSYFNPLSPVDVDLDKLTEIVWSGWTGDFFPNEHEANGVFAVVDSDIHDQELYNAIQEMVKTWEEIDSPEIGGVIYRRKLISEGKN